MKKHLKNTLIIMLLSIFLLSNKVSASDILNDVQTINAYTLFSSNQKIVGIKADSIDSLTALDTINSNTAYLQDINIIYHNNQYTVNCEMEIDNSLMYCEYSGKLYKNTQTEHAAISNNLILGELGDYNNFHVVQFKIDKNALKICMILQHTETLALYQFDIGIGEADFSGIFENITNDLPNKELEEKINHRFKF